MLAAAAGTAVVAGTVVSALATFVVPRALPARLTRVVFLSVRRMFDLRIRLARSYEAGEGVMAWYAPVSLLVLVGTWLLLIMGGFTLLFRAAGVESWTLSLEVAGSSLTTLGFVPVEGLGRQLLAFVDAALGLLLLALLITYLPTIYASFQRREALVARAAMQTTTPPTGVDLLLRFHGIRGFEALTDQVWEPWIAGFLDIEESHTSLASLAFFRSPRRERHWVTSSGAVLDAASLINSTVDIERQPSAALCVRAGFLSLRHIADLYGIPYEPEPQRGDPISITKEEWLAARARLGDAGVPLRDDVEEAWLDFQGWRVNYDTVLLALAGLLVAPYAPWISDRGSTRGHRPPTGLRRR